ncbi:ankyrin repeat-containing domain protein, partial [Lactarius deliciosus]
MTPLHCAASDGRLEVARLLLERNAEVNSRDDRGATPLLSASQNGHRDLVPLLLDHSADVRIRDYHGNTPLRSAATKGHLDVARILLEHNAAEVNSQDDLGSALLHASRRSTVISRFFGYYSSAMRRSMSRIPKELPHFLINCSEVMLRGVCWTTLQMSMSATRETSHTIARCVTVTLKLLGHSSGYYSSAVRRSMPATNPYSPMMRPRP